MSDELLREVQEEIQRERLTKLAKAVAPYAIAVALGVVAVTAGYKGWQYWQVSQAREEAARFEAALALLQANEAETAAMSFNRMAESAGSGYADLAALHAADALHMAGKQDAAMKRFAEIADSGDYDRYTRSIAALKAAYLALATGKPMPGGLDIGDFAKEGEPLRHSLLEVEALIALRQGDAKQARDYYRKLELGVETPEGIRNRAVEMGRALARQLGEEPEAAEVTPEEVAPAAGTDAQ